MAPQIIMIVLIALAIGSSVEETSRRGDFKVVSDIAGMGIVHALLWWGGFYDCFYT